MPRFASPSSVLSLALAACAADGPREDLTENAAAVNAGDEAVETLVYEAVREKTTEDAVPTLTAETGILDNDVWQRAARPHLFMHEPVTYIARRWRKTLDSGAIEQGFRVTTVPNPSPSVQAPTGGPPRIHPLLLEQVAALDPDDMATVEIMLRNYPQYDIPLLPSPDTLSVTDYDALVAEREQAMLDRQADFDVLTAGLQADLVAAGGVIDFTYWQFGGLTATVPASFVAALALRDDLALLTTSAQNSATGMGQSDARVPARMNIAPYWNSQYDGRQANPARHNFGAIAIAVIEPGALEDEACAFFTSNACSGDRESRIVRRFRCDDPTPGSPVCEPVADFSAGFEASLPGSNHGTNVASAALGDYLDNQGQSHALGDPAYPPHTADWKAQSSGMAPEAKLLYFGGRIPGGDDTSYTKAILQAVIEGADIITSGWGFFNPPCDTLPYSLAEAAASVAWQEGVFIVTLTDDNEQTEDPNECFVNAPAQNPRVMAVNGLDMSTTSCNQDYKSCNRSTWAFARGGATVSVSGSPPTDDNVSVIDLAVPHDLFSITHSENALGVPQPVGEVREDIFTGGLSIAAPVTAGAAGVSKGYFIANNEQAINFPGWLHTFMLAMGDRHRSPVPSNPNVATWQQPGTDKYYGLGRLKLRPPFVGLYGDDSTGTSFGPGSGTVTLLLNQGPLPAGTTFVKCVMAQFEDMHAKSNISNINLELKIRQKGCSSGVCTCSPGYAETGSTQDNSLDDKSVVAIASDVTTLADRCAYAKMIPVSVTQTPVPTQLFCYWSDVKDDEPSQ